MSVYHLLLLLSLGEISAASNERNSNETFIECGLGYRNCSQKLRRFDCDNEFFNCSVGGKDEIKTFENTISLSKGCNVRFDAPELLGISSDCLKNSAINQRQTIEITFRLPKAFFCNKSDEDQSQHVGHYQFPKAIYLNLSRVREEDYSDPWSFTCPGERIFIFHKYSPRLNYDAGSPRNLTYRHRLGLNLSNQSYSYILNLTTAEGRSRYFNIKLPVRDNNSANWRPAVATTLDVIQRTIDVIVEPQPSVLNFTGYQVTLCSLEDQCNQHNQIDSTKTNSTRFENITHGVYYVKVMSSPCATSNCLEVKSFRVDALAIPKIADEFQHMQITVIVAGSVVGVALLVILTYCLRRCGPCARIRIKSDKKPQGIVLHPFLDLSRSNSSTDRNYLKVMEYFQNFIVKAFDCELVPIPLGCINCNKTALDKLFSGLVFVIVVCANDNGNPYFKQLLARAMQKRKKQKNLLVISVTLSCFPSPITHECIADLEMITLLENIHNLSPFYNKIHASKLKDDDSSKLIQFNIDYPEYQTLEKSIKDASPLAHFENTRSHTECDTEIKTKHICQTERNIQLHSSICGKDSHQHKPYEQDIEENRKEKKRQVASLKANLSKVNDSSSDIFYNESRAQENMRELPVASEQVRRESNRYNQRRERQCKQLEPRAPQLGSGEHSCKLTVTHPPILNYNKKVHFKTFPVLQSHQIRSRPSDYEHEHVLHASNLKEDDSSLFMPCNIDSPEYQTLKQSIIDASQWPHFENSSSEIDYDTEKDTKHICQTERKIPFLLTKCERDGHQHTPCEQYIDEKSPERKRQEVASIKANLSRFNDSSFDIFYNGAQENRQELPLASEQLGRESNGYIRNQGREQHCQQFEYHRALQFDSDETSLKMPI